MDRRQELIDKARETARRLGKPTLTRAEFVRETGIGAHIIHTRFDGWRDLCRQAGLDGSRHNDPIPDDAMYRAMCDAFLELGGVTSRKEFRPRFRYSLNVIYRRGMVWTDALRAFRDWVEENAPDFPYLDQLPAGPARRRQARRPPVRPRGARTFGDGLDFRALRHAPINEQGVVLLFGMVAAELGFLVEAVAPGFPDCEGKRQIAPGRWERVRIEFEFQSRGFRDHGHDPAGCDLVVCWEHNWPDCPLEVLALKTAIETLPSGAAPPNCHPRA